MPPAQVQSELWWTSRGAALGVSAGVFLACFFYNAGDAWLAATAVGLMEGTVALGVIVVAGLLGAAILRWTFGPTFNEISILLRWSSGVALGLGLFSLTAFGLGMAGWFNRPTAIAMLTIAAVVGGIKGVRKVFQGKKGVRKVIQISSLTTTLNKSSKTFLTPLSEKKTFLTPFYERWGDWLRRPAGWGWLWVAVMPVLAIAVLGATMPPGILWGDEPHWYDVMEYHLQVPREWYEAGRMMPLHHNVFSYFPFNVEMLYWLAMELRGGPWAGMYVAQYLHLGMTVVFVMAMAGAAGEWGGTAAKNTVGVLVAATPWLALLAPVAYNEGGLLLYGGLAMAWGLRAICPKMGTSTLFPTEQGVDGRNLGRKWWMSPFVPSHIRAMALAGVMGGLACGVKLTAVPMVLLALGIGMVAVEIAGRRKFPRMGGYLTYFLVGGLVFSPWLIRNLAWTGNPVFPEAMQLLGRSHFTPVQVERWNRAHAAAANQQTIGSKWSAGWTRVGIDWRYGGLLWIAAIASAVAGWRRRPVWILLITGAGILFIWLFFTHLQSRFFILGIPIAGLMAAMPRGKWAHGLTAGAAATAAMFGWYGVQSKLDPYLQRGVVNAIGLEDYRPLMPSQQVVDILDGADDLALIGDAAAFKYQIPMTRLSYRTVFDVPSDGDVVHSWLADDSIKASPPTWLLIDPAELERFTRTYWQIPPTPGWVRQRGGPFVVNAGDIPARDIPGG